MRSILQNSFVAAAVATVTADAATLSTAAGGLPTLLAQKKYSRKFEIAADDYAFRLLLRNGYSPVAFATIMERIGMKTKKNRWPLVIFPRIRPLTCGCSAPVMQRPGKKSSLDFDFEEK